MRNFSARVVKALSVVVLVSGCSNSPTVAPPFVLTLPEAPDSLRPPANQVLAVEAIGRGVQIYECTATQGQPGQFEWVFKAPDAELVDLLSRRIGKHYAGPTWESTDGSTVVGEVKARADGPNPSAIPWLLLTAKSSSGTGVFSQVKSIQRLQTVDGKAPSAACSRDYAGQVARVPYRAAYYFYVLKP